MTEKCNYCQGNGFYFTYSWGLKQKELCQFCNGTGETNSEKNN